MVGLRLFLPEDMVECWGYSSYFASTALIVLPVALLCLLVWRLSAPPAGLREAEQRL